MTNKNGDRGARYERAVADLWQAAGFLWGDRKPRRGARDQGDITGIEDWTLECKDWEKIDLAGFVDEAAIEAANAGTRWFAAVIKRRRKNVRESYVVMPLWLFINLVKQLLGMEAPVCRHCGNRAA